MNFDWNDHDQVGGIEWVEFQESEDHIVPYPKNSVFTSEDCSKKPCNDDANTIAQTIRQSSGAKNELPECNLQNSSCFHSNELSGPRLDMDTWPDLPSLNTEISAVSLVGARAQYDDEFGLFGEDKGHESFLDGDWTDIGDFGDLDRIFRDDSVFGHDMATNVDDFLPQSADAVDSSLQSIPMPDIPLNGDREKGCSPFRSIEQSDGKRKNEYKIADVLESEEQAIHPTHCSDRLTEKDDRKKRLLKSHKKAEERSNDEASQILNDPWPHNTSQSQPYPGPIAPSPALYAPSFSQTEPTESIGPHSPYTFSQYGYPAYPFPDGQLKPSAMTPQEKIEKLRRRQQAHAMLAIQQQQQQFGHHQNVGGPQTIGSQVNFSKNNSRDTVSSVGVAENDEPRGTSTSVDDNALKQTVYFQLQDAMRKLDTSVRLCIRDSLFRLARSSLERQNAGDTDSTIINLRDASEVRGIGVEILEKRWAMFQDTETCTNPIDRTVAHLLFHRPLESSTRPTNDGLPQSNLLHNPGDLFPDTSHGRETDGFGFGELELGPTA